MNKGETTMEEALRQRNSKGGSAEGMGLFPIG